MLSTKQRAASISFRVSGFISLFVLEFYGSVNTGKVMSSHFWWACMSIGDQEVVGSIQARSGSILLEIFSTIILSLPLIQEGQLSVSGKRV